MKYIRLFVGPGRDLQLLLLSQLFSGTQLHQGVEWQMWINVLPNDVST